MGVARGAEVTTAVSIAPSRSRRMDGVTPGGVVAIGVWILIAIAVVLMLVASIDSDRLATYGGRIAWGFVTTLKLVAWSFVVGAILSVPVAAGRLSEIVSPARSLMATRTSSAARRSSPRSSSSTMESASSHRS